VGLVQSCAIHKPQITETTTENVVTAHKHTSVKRCKPDESVVNDLQVCSAKLQGMESDTHVVNQQTVQIDKLRNELESAKQRIEGLKKKNSELEEDLKKKDEAIRRLREVTLGS
jgi:septal ring factor EnvC (AmiA/AmiB activator)